MSSAQVRNHGQRGPFSDESKVEEDWYGTPGTMVPHSRPTGQQDQPQLPPVQHFQPQHQMGPPGPLPPSFPAQLSGQQQLHQGIHQHAGHQLLPIDTQFGGGWRPQPPPAPHVYSEYQNMLESSSATMAGRTSFSALAPPPPPPPPNSGTLPDGRVLVKDEVVPDHVPPQPRQRNFRGRSYQLECVQHPERSRMCGHGDKDRRNMTPVPAVRVTVTDTATGTVLDLSENDIHRFICVAELWNFDGSVEFTSIKNQPAGGGGGSSASTPYRGPSSSPATHGFPPQHSMGNYAAPSPGGYQETSPFQNEPHSGYGYAQLQSQSYQRGYNTQYQSVSLEERSSHHAGRYPTPYTRNRHNSQSSPQASSTFTRTLIGTNCDGAKRLLDDKDVYGIWFVFGDLSVRSEGWFRLKFQFCDTSVGLPLNPPPHMAPVPSSLINNQKVQILATAWSNPFHVIPAKRFPGVANTTALSRAFQRQGIKLSVRKDNKGNKGDEGGDDENDDDD